MDKELFADLVQSLKEMDAIVRGDMPPSRVFVAGPDTVKPVPLWATSAAQQSCDSSRYSHARLTKCDSANQIAADAATTSKGTSAAGRANGASSRHR